MSTAALTTVLAKFAGLHVAAKAGVGLAVAAGAVGAAAGAPVVVHELSGTQSVAPAGMPASPTPEPSDLATTEPTAEPTAEPAAGPTAGPTDAPTGVPTDAPTSWQDAERFGAWVSEDARDGGVDGQEISQAARDRAALRHAAEADPTGPGTGEDELGEDEADEDETVAPAGPAEDEAPAPAGAPAAGRGAQAPGHDR